MPCMVCGKFEQQFSNNWGSGVRKKRIVGGMSMNFQAYKKGQLITTSDNLATGCGASNGEGSGGMD